jgi:drug/metabolite transporter superfamily protein YnfA
MQYTSMRKAHVRGTRGSSGTYHVAVVAALPQQPAAAQGRVTDAHGHLHTCNDMMFNLHARGMRADMRDSGTGGLTAVPEAASSGSGTEAALTRSE